MPTFAEAVKQLSAITETVGEHSRIIEEMQDPRGPTERRIDELQQQVNDIRPQVAQHERFYLQNFKSGAPSIPTWNVRQLEDDPMLDQPWRAYSQHLKAGTHITIEAPALSQYPLVNCILTNGTHIEITDEAINCTLLGGTHVTIDGENINHDAVGEWAADIIVSGVVVCANAWADALGHVHVE